MSETLLEQIRALVNVDLDSMDPEVAVRHTTSKDTFGDMTSNQGIVNNEATRLEKRHLAEKAVALARSERVLSDEASLISHILRILSVLLAKEVYPHLRGNVHVQTSPSAAYNVEETIREAEELVSLFQDQGIPKERVCIKIPATPESLVACRVLAGKGIQTLATCLFSLSQAAAASQAGCIYVAPYFNELRVHFDPSLWRAYENTDEHPMCPIISSILGHFKGIQSKTLVMPASIVTAEEVIALTRLGPNHLTLSPTILDSLAKLPAVDAESLKPRPRGNTLSPYSKDVDFLVNDGQRLREELLKDKETSRKLKDALSIFNEREELTKTFIKALL